MADCNSARWVFSEFAAWATMLWFFSHVTPDPGFWTKAYPCLWWWLVVMVIIIGVRFILRIIILALR